MIMIIGTESKLVDMLPQYDFDNHLRSAVSHPTFRTGNAYSALPAQCNVII